MDLRELYQELIIDHNRHPRNQGALTAPSHQAKGANPLCGDQLAVSLCIEAGVLQDIKFIGKGCAISQASASLMTEAVLGLDMLAIDRLFHEFHQLLTSDEEVLALPQKLKVFSGVRAYPARVKCATLAWHTLKAALEAQDAFVSTE